MLRGKVIKLKSLRFFSLSFNIKEIKKKALSKQNMIGINKYCNHRKKNSKPKPFNEQAEN